MAQENDRIVYLSISQPGGVDGKDHTDKGGAIVKASFNLKDVETRDTRYRVERRVVDVVEGKKAALAKLDPLERLLIAMPDPNPKRSGR